MALVKDSVKIIEELISLLTVIVPITSVTTNIDGSFTLLSTDTQHISVKRQVNINGTTYSVQEIVQDISITVVKIMTSDPDPIVIDIILPPPFFINGTIISAKRELDEEDWKDKYPMVFLYEVYRERWKSSKTEPIAFDTKLRLFFMEQTNQGDYTTSDQYVEKIRPMRSLVMSFIDLIESNRCKFGELETDFELIPWVNFGKFKTDTGNIQAYFNDAVSGYELVVDLPVKKSYIEA